MTTCLSLLITGLRSENQPGLLGKVSLAAGNSASHGCRSLGLEARTITNWACVRHGTLRGRCWVPINTDHMMTASVRMGTVWERERATVLLTPFPATLPAANTSRSPLSLSHTGPRSGHASSAAGGEGLAWTLQLCLTSSRCLRPPPLRAPCLHAGYVCVTACHPNPHADASTDDTPTTVAHTPCAQ